MLRLMQLRIKRKNNLLRLKIPNKLGEKKKENFQRKNLINLRKRKKSKTQKKPKSKEEKKLKMLKLKKDKLLQMRINKTEKKFEHTIVNNIFLSSIIILKIHFPNTYSKYLK